MAYSRYPKGYDGTQVTTRSIGALLRGVLDQIDRRMRMRPQHVLQVWPEVVGPQMAPFTKATRFQEGVLHVTVSNSMVYSLLASSEKMQLIEQLQQVAPTSGVCNIVFRLG